MEDDLIAHVLAALLVLVGLAGLVLPMLPGAPIIFLGLLLDAWADDFEHAGLGTMVVVGLFALLTYAVDFAASTFGAKRFGASNRAAIGAGLGAMVGVFFGLPGILLGPFVGAVVGELTVQRNLNSAGRAGAGATMGLIVGAALKWALAAAMIGFYIVSRFSFWS